MIRENFNVYKAIIVGAGMSGLTASIILSKRFFGKDIALIERLDRVGKKILSTGNGQCNLTNLDSSFCHYHSGLDGFFVPTLEKFSNLKMIEFFNELGVLTTVSDNKVYPISKQASSVLDALRFKIDNLNVDTFLGSKVIKAEKQKHFIVTLENGQVLYGENLIIAVGGKSAPHLGTDGSSYDLITSFGHKLTKLYPSLVQLKTDKNSIKGMKGLKLTANVKAVSNGKVLVEKKGEVLFTDYGVSGNAIFYASSYVVDKKAKLVLDLVPELTQSELINFLEKKQSICSYLTVENMLSGIINNKIGSAILRNSGKFNLNQSITKVNIKDIVNFLKNYELEVVGSMGFDYSQVTKGGIDVIDINRETLESKLIKGLYLAGEVLDVDGDCGGYNLWWAFSSALVVANSIK